MAVNYVISKMDVVKRYHGGMAIIKLIRSMDDAAILLLQVTELRIRTLRGARACGASKSTARGRAHTIQ